ncbi:MAG: DUF521 domain-containing protein [Deltaproteobacteria bacterium]|nr:DUF521 domain-containing protein [Deltaproteobacteria bacterium]
MGRETTLHGTESAIAASLLGLVPEFGVLLDENRKRTLRIEVTAHLEHPADWGALGYFAGKLAGLGIPVFTGARRSACGRCDSLILGRGGCGHRSGDSGWSPA